MTNEEFVKKMNQKSIKELAEERVHAVLTNKQSVDTLFRKYYDFFAGEELDLIKRVITEALDNTRSSDLEELKPDQELLQLFCAFATAKDAMRDLVIMMAHDMRDENDFAGLTELHDSVIRLPYNLYQPLAFILFNDLYDTLPIYAEEDSSWYQSFVKVLNSHFAALRKKADNEWAAWQRTASDEGDPAPRELTREYIHELWERHSAQEDMLLQSTVEKREIMALGFLMMITRILRDEVLVRANNCRENNDYNSLADLLRTLDKIDGISDNRRQKCAGLLFGSAEE